jgi:hypothetical protein
MYFDVLWAILNTLVGIKRLQSHLTSSGHHEKKIFFVFSYLKLRKRPMAM